MKRPFFAKKGLLLFFSLIFLSSWGFFAHKKINHQAVYSLPADLFAFYRQHQLHLTEHAVDPDKRRYIVAAEACRHYIDLDHYPEILSARRVFRYNEAVDLYTEDTLFRHGTLPWTILLNMQKLEQAFRDQDATLIIKYSTDLGHYIGDAHVPLHTTSNYNGQLSNQHGIHGLWESRLPELYFDRYDLWVGQASFLASPADSVWECIFDSQDAVQKVLQAEREATALVSERKKYSVEHRKGMPVKTYSPLFCKHYNRLLGDMVETRLRKAIKFTADCWYTCWVNAGKPDLPTLREQSIDVLSEEEKGNAAIPQQAADGCIH